MFKTVRRQLDRPQPTGKALVFKRIIISSIFIATFFTFQMIQLGKIGPSLDNQYKLIQEATSNSENTVSGVLEKLEVKFDGSEAFFDDKVFSEAPMSERLEKSIKTETLLAQQESVGARGPVILFEVFKWVLPGAVETTDNHDQRLAEFFKSDEYRNSAIASIKAKDLTAAIQYCRGTPLSADKSPEGYTENNMVTSEEKAKRAKLIEEAADRTICASIPDIQK
jgi:hypothetical protein